MLTVRSKLTISFSTQFVPFLMIGAVKVIPQYCTAHPLLRIKIT